MMGLSNVLPEFVHAGWLKIVMAIALLTLASFHWSRNDGYKVALDGWHNPRGGFRPDIPAADPTEMARLGDWVAGFKVMGQAIHIIAPRTPQWLPCLSGPLATTKMGP